MKALAIVLWVLAWCAVSIAAAAGWAALRGRDPAVAAVWVITASLAGAGFALAGAALW